MKKRLTALVLLVALLVISSTGGGEVRANASGDRLDSIVIELMINEDGSGSFIETWQTQVASGTENYKPLGNLQGATISDFVVFDNDAELLDIGEWNTQAAASEKAGRYGIATTPTGIELCWGIGNYGYHTYRLEYTVQNIVQLYDDYAGIYWQFVSPQMNPLAQQVTVTISAAAGFNAEELAAWSFGYTGGWTIDPDQGRVTLETGAALTQTQFVEAMLRFPLGLVTAGTLRTSSFEEAMAVHNSGVASAVIESYKMNIAPYEPSFSPEVPEAIMVQPYVMPRTAFGLTRGQFLVAIIVALFVVGLALGNLQARRPNEIQKAVRDVAYRDDFLPGDDLLANYWLLKEANATDQQRLVQAMMISWAAQGYLSIEGDPEGLPEEQVVVFKGNGVFGSALENELYQLIFSALNGSPSIVMSELTEWFRENAKQLWSWSQKVNAASLDRALHNGFIAPRKSLFGRRYQITPYGQEQLQRLLSYREYFGRTLEEQRPTPEEMAIFTEYGVLYGKQVTIKNYFESYFPRYLSLMPNYWGTYFSVNCFFLLSIGLYNSAGLYHTNAANNDAVQAYGINGLSGGVSMGGGGGMGGAVGGGRR